MRTTLRAARWLLLAAGLAALGLVAAAPAFADHNEDRHTDNIRVAGQSPFPYGSDLAFKGNFAIAGSGDWDGAYHTGMRVFNVANPSAPQELSFAHCDGWHSDVDFVGQRYAVQSYDSDAPTEENSHEGGGACSPGQGEQGIRVYDVSNPTAPESIGFAVTRHGSHNLTAVGDTGLVYNSSYNLGNPSDVDGVSIVNVADNPENPEVNFLEFPDVDNRPDIPDMKNESGRLPAAPGCHDIGIHTERELAFCAGITETQIWDISDPRDPVIIEIIYNPGVNIHHGALPNAEGDVLILNDEWLGAAGGPTGCLVPGAPTGALWFYDISDPTNPQVRNWWSPKESTPQNDFCTSHFFEAFENDGRDQLVTSWYDQGVYVVDFTDPSAPEMVAQYDPEGATFWGAYAHNGALFASSFAPATFLGNDEANLDKGGLWVFELDGYSRSDDASAGAGSG